MKVLLLAIIVAPLVPAAWIIAEALAIWRFGRRSSRRRADCVIVLGASVWGDQPSPVFRERIRHGMELLRRGQAPCLLFTGGRVMGRRHAEARVAADFARSHGVPDRMILLEDRSQTTYENLVEARRLMQEAGLRSALIVSDPLHLRRAILMGRRLGMQVFPSPTTTTRYLSARKKARFLWREVLSVIWFRVLAY